MAYSTGRGGAGNIQNSTTITSHDNDIKNSDREIPKSPNLEPTVSTTDQQQQSQSPSQQPQEEKKVYYSTGRGGAGNIKSSNVLPSPKLIPQGSNTPQLTSQKVSTGRGGYGNMLKNDNPELVRKLQDVDSPSTSQQQNELYAVASNKSFSIGRGGFGNVVSTSRSNGSKNDNGGNNLMAISSHGDRSINSKKKPGFLAKVKSYFTS